MEFMDKPTTLRTVFDASIKDGIYELKEYYEIRGRGKRLLSHGSVPVSSLKPRKRINLQMQCAFGCTKPRYEYCVTVLRGKVHFETVGCVAHPHAPTDDFVDMWERWVRLKEAYGTTTEDLLEMDAKIDAWLRG